MVTLFREMLKVCCIWQLIAHLHHCLSSCVSNNINQGELVNKIALEVVQRSSLFVKLTNNILAVEARKELCQHGCFKCVTYKGSKLISSPACKNRFKGWQTNCHFSPCLLDLLKAFYRKASFQHLIPESCIVCLCTEITLLLSNNLTLNFFTV